MSNSPIIHMISGPRNISTAMLYSFDNRPDCIGIDEPFYGNYLTRFPDVNHPGRLEIIESMSIGYQKVIDEIYSQSSKSPYVFIKNMSHHLAEMDLNWMKDHRVFMLIRHPSKVISSFTKVISDPIPRDIGIIQQLHIYETLTELGLTVTIINTDKFLQHPYEQMQLLCESLKIPYDPAMLEWTPGSRVIDGVWAPHWYQSVHKSSGFKQTNLTQPPKIEDRYLPIYEAVLPSYQKLEQRTL